MPRSKTSKPVTIENSFRFRESWTELKDIYQKAMNDRYLCMGLDEAQLEDFLERIYRPALMNELKNKEIQIKFIDSRQSKFFLRELVDFIIDKMKKTDSKSVQDFNENNFKKLHNKKDARLFLRNKLLAANELFQKDDKDLFLNVYNAWNEKTELSEPLPWLATRSSILCSMLRFTLAGMMALRGTNYLYNGNEEAPTAAIVLYLAQVCLVSYTQSHLLAKSAYTEALQIDYVELESFVMQSYEKQLAEKAKKNALRVKVEFPLYSNDREPNNPLSTASTSSDDSSPSPSPVKPVKRSHIASSDKSKVSTKKKLFPKTASAPGNPIIEGNTHYIPLKSRGGAFFFKVEHDSEDSDEALIDRIEKSVEGNREIHGQSSKEQGIKKVGAHEPFFNDRNIKYKIKFPRGPYRNLRIGVADREATADEEVTLRKLENIEGKITILYPTKAVMRK